MTAADIREARRVTIVVRRLRDVDRRDLRFVDVVLLQEIGDLFAFHEQDRMRDALFDDDLRRAYDFFLIAFGKNDALRIMLGAIEDELHDAA